MKSCCFFLILILNISFLNAEDILADTSLEKQTLQENNSQTESNTTESFLDKNSTIIEDSLKKEVAILEPDSFTPSLNSESFSSQPILKPEIISEKDFKTPPPKIDIPRKKTFLAVGLTALIPGLGHVYLKEYSKAGIIFGSTAAGVAARFNKHTSFPGYVAQNLATSYGIYAAYRDVRLYNNNVGFSYKMPTDSFKDLCLASFSLSVLKKPEVWGGFLGFLATGIGITYLQSKLHIKPHLKISAADAYPLSAFSIGIREETLFRGYLQSTLSESLTPIGGIILSSLAFGAVHIPNAKNYSLKDRMNYYKISLPFITSFGLYAGWMTYKNQSLKQSVALHSWYDFTLFAIRRALTRSAMIGKPNFSFSFSY